MALTLPLCFILTSRKLDSIEMSLIRRSLLAPNESFSPIAPSKLWHAWSGWKEISTKLKAVLEEKDTTSRPMQVIRLVVGVGSNFGLMLFGILNDPNFYYFVLILCLVNMSLYFANYVVAKVSVLHSCFADVQVVYFLNT